MCSPFTLSMTPKRNVLVSVLFLQAIDSPFTAAHPETLFHAAQFLLNTLSILPEVPFRVSIVYVLYTLAKQGYNLGAYKMARMAFDRLGVYRVPVSWQDAVDLTVLTIQSKPFSDKEVCVHILSALFVFACSSLHVCGLCFQDLLPYCYRCSSNNPLISSARSGDCCVNCGHPFIRTFSTFDPLPLVKFVPEG
jgi:intraflagellar transport protein 122